MFDFPDVAVHVFLMDEPVTGCFPRFLGIHQFEMESPEQSGNQLLHFHQGNILHVKKVSLEIKDTFPTQIRGPCPKARLYRSIFLACSLDPNHLSGRNLSVSGPKTDSSR